MLFSDISHLIFQMIQSYYNEISCREINTELVLSYQTAGDFVRWHPHWHGILLEGGFDEEGNFIYLPISDTKKMTELYRRLVSKLFVDKKSINEDFAKNLLS